MDKKKIKLKLSGNLKKSISNIERAKTQGKNSVLIEKKSNKFSNKRSFNFNRQDTNFKKNNSTKLKTQIYDKPNVPRLEQIQSTAAAAQNILLALHDKGYGAYWRTGKYSTERNEHISSELSLDKNDEVLGYLYVGTPEVDAPKIPELANNDFVTYWN